MDTQRLQEAIYHGIEAEKQRIILEIIERSKVELEKQLQEIAARVAVNICRKVSFEPYGPNAIKIIVEFPETRK